MEVPRSGGFIGAMNPERIRMWQAAEALLAELDRIVVQARESAPNAADHLERSGESVLFNIAEGVGAYAPKMKIAAYEIAKKEANEVRAILRRLVMRRAVTSAQIDRPYNLASAIVVMLTRAIQTLSRRLA
jgi:four helix bundle protein